MTQPRSLAPLTTIPDDIGAELQHLLQMPHDPAIGDWLYDLIRSSGHLSTGDNMQWRLLCMIWLAVEYDLDKAWPYLMWLNMNEAVMSDHLTEILTEAIDEFNCHLRMAKWLAEIEEERLAIFFSRFQNFPLPYKMGEIFGRLVHQPDLPEVEPWLANFCRQTAGQVSPYIRPWHLFAATWYATYFNPAEGLTYLKAFSDDQRTLSAEANHTLTELAEQLNCMAALMQWIAACPDSDVKAILKEFGHLDLAAFVEAVFQEEPDYTHLADSASLVTEHTRIFKRNLKLLEQAGLAQSSQILDLACGPLATQALLFHASGYKTTAAGLHIPPASLPLSGIKQRLKRGKYVKAWRRTTEAYYAALAYEVGLKLNWKKLKINLADLRRLDFADYNFNAVLCCHHLQHAPDVAGLLAEVARILKPGGLFLADIKPYPSLSGGFNSAATSPWEHVRRANPTPRPTKPILNKWREAQYRAALEQYFILKTWLTEQDQAAAAILTPDLRDELADYSEEELTRKEIVFLARKK